VRHPAIPRLLAYLDGEIPLHDRFSVKLHLLGCWQCRAMCASLEAGAHRLSHATDKAAAPRAQARFEAWRWRYEQSLPATAPKSRWRYAAIVPVLLALPFAAQMWPPAEIEIIAPRFRYPSPPTLEAATAPAKAPSFPRTPLALELDVHYRLHRIGVCAAEPVLITKKSDGQIEVTAMAPPREREREIRQALAGLVATQRVQLRITPAPESVLLAEGAGAPAAKPVISQAMWESGIPKRFPDFSQSAALLLREADRLYSHAWALKRHTELPTPTAASDTNAYWLRHSMLRDHLTELRQALNAIQSELKPISRKSPVASKARPKPLFDLAFSVNSHLQHFLQSDSAEELSTEAPGDDGLWAALEALDLELSRAAQRNAAANP
jgi:hypothetical protein